MEDDLIFWSWKMTSIFWKWKTTFIFGKLKTTSIFLKIKDYTNFFENSRRPQFFWNLRQPKLYLDGRSFFLLFKWKTTSIFLNGRWPQWKGWKPDYTVKENFIMQFNKCIDMKKHGNVCNQEGRRGRGDEGIRWLILNRHDNSCIHGTIGHGNMFKLWRDIIWMSALNICVLHGNRGTT